MISAAIALSACLSHAAAEPPPPQAVQVPGGPNATALPEAEPEMRELLLKHHGTGESLEVIYRIGDDYQPEAMARIDHFMRDWRCKKSTVMDPKLIDRLWELQQEVGEHRPIRLISGFRSEGYNASLLVAGRTVDPESQHMVGKAVDIFIPGVKPEKVKDAAESQNAGGVGYYPFSGPRFVHVDTGPQRHWTEMDPAVRRKLGIARQKRAPFKLNCELTMAEALREVSPMDAISALPPGAAVDPAATLRSASFLAYGASQGETPDPTAPADAQPVAEKRGACEVDEGLAPLSPLAGLAAPLGIEP